MSYYPPPPPGPPPSPPPGYHPNPPGYPGYGGYPAYPPNQAARFGWTYAGFWERFAAALIDGLVLTLAALPIIAIGVALVVANWETELGTCTDIDGFDYVCDVPTAETIAYILLAAGLYLLVSLLLIIIYYGRWEGERTQTIGKRALGIRTVRASTGQPLGFGRGVGRYFARILSGSVFYLGYLWMLWDNDKQTWHDKIVESIVVKA